MHQTSGVSSKAIADAQMYCTDRKTYVATYLFSRALVPILSQTNLTSITLQTTERLEQIAFTTLRALNVTYLARFPMKRALWRMMKHLLELLSTLNFEGVSSRFLFELRTFHKDLSNKQHANRLAIDNDAGHVLKSMRHLRLPTDPGEAWKRSCHFMQIIIQLFAEVHGQSAKVAYCKMIGGILLTIGDKSHADFDNELWRRVVGRLNDRLTQLASKPKYWQVAYAVQATLACVSPYEQLLAKCQGLSGTLSSKLRERNNRATALKAICRLTWSYLRRTVDSRDTVLKYLEDLAKAVFFSGKRYSLSLEPAVTEPLIQFIRIIGHSAQEMCLKGVVFPLLNYDMVSAKEIKDLKADQLDPDRTCIAIRAFLALLADIEAKEAPSFPMAFDDEQSGDSAEDFSPIGPASIPYSFKPDRLSKSVITSDLSESFRPYYTSFCRTLGKILTILSESFNGQIASSEKSLPMLPKTPITEAWNFKREDLTSMTDDKAGYYELLRVAIQALPRCLVNQPSLGPLLHILCNGTVHLDRGISSSSYKSLLSIARQGHAHTVIERFSGFIFNRDEPNYALKDSDGTKSNWHAIESPLRLYIELLYIWKDEIHSKNTKSSLTLIESNSNNNRTGQFDISGTWTQIDRVESHGLLYLCSPSNRVRLCAVEILAIVMKLDGILGQANIRIANILQSDSDAILNLPDETLSSWERGRLERGRRQSGGQPTLIDLACSPGEHDTTLWIKLFPNLIRDVFLQCPVAVTQTREDVCSRLSKMHGMIEALDDRHRAQQQAPPFDAPPIRQARIINSALVGMTVLQWKLYLMFACTTLTRAGANHTAQQQDADHARKASRSSQGTQETISTARDVFAKVIPLLSASFMDIRDAAVVGLGSININLYKPLLESVEATSRQPVDDRKNMSSHQRITSSPRRHQSSNQSNSQYQTEIVQVYKSTAHFLSSPIAYGDEWILSHISGYTRGLSMILRKAEDNWDYQRRIGYCGLVEGFYLGIMKTEDQEKWMSFGARRAAFSLMEEWCGHSTTQDTAKLQSFEHSPGHVESEYLANQPAVRAHEQNQLRIVALSAMATLCVSR